MKGRGQVCREGKKFYVKEGLEMEKKYTVLSNTKKGEMKVSREFGKKNKQTCIIRK